MAEYLFTNLPQYVKLNSRSEFSSSVVSSGAVLLFTEDGYTLTGKLPDGTFITIGGSGGTDVSSTTAEAGDVLAGKIFYTSGGVKTSGSIPTVSATSAGSQITVPSGYIASAQSFPVSAGSDVTLGYVNEAGMFQPLTFSGTTAYDSGSPEQVASYYTWNTPISSGSSSTPGDAVIYYSGGVVSSAAVMTGNRFFGGTVFVYSGGSVTSASLYDGAGIWISSGGYAGSIDIYGNNCALIVDSGGYASKAMLYDGSPGNNTQVVGSAEDFSVYSGANLSVENGGIMSNVKVYSGGAIYIASSATAVTGLDVYSGGSVIDYR